MKRNSFLAVGPRPEPGAECRFELPAKFGVCRFKLGSRGAYIPRFKRSMVKIVFFVFWGGQIYTFFRLVSWRSRSKDHAQAIPEKSQTLQFSLPASVTAYVLNQHRRFFGGAELPSKAGFRGAVLNYCQKIPAKFEASRRLSSLELKLRISDRGKRNKTLTSLRVSIEGAVLALKWRELVRLLTHEYMFLSHIHVSTRGGANTRNARSPRKQVNKKSRSSLRRRELTWNYIACLCFELAEQRLCLIYEPPAEQHQLRWPICVEDKPTFAPI